jgi:hypothetical protein
LKAILLCLLLTGCALPRIDTAGTVSCTTWSTLTVRATTVYIHADRPGTVVVQPDCAVAATVAPDLISSSDDDSK